ncbi:T9SS type A sorting domain-containing protein [candidate division KSB1 bacterium]|nr:T9SS type A sorting domain-containing protein [candidate division KSB1 bacterium]
MLKKCTLIFLTLASLSGAQSFVQFTTKVNISPPEERQALVDSFLVAVGDFPYIENDTLVHFLYYGTASSVHVPGDANGWSVNGFPMFKLSTTNLWYVTKNFESDARLDYKLILNGYSWILDPRNPNQVTGGYGPNSELRMPKYIPPEEIKYDAAIPHGTVKDSTVFSAHLNNSRRIKIYTPPGYAESNKTYAMILVHDGLDYVNLAKMNNVLDFLIYHKRIEPLIALFVPAVDRTPEYAGAKQDAFGDFIIKELMPHFESNYRIDKNPDRRLVMGASNGGNISLYLGFMHPEVFGNVAAQSSFIQPSLDRGFREKNRLPLKLYLDLGTYDIASLIPLVRNFVPVLQAKEYPFRYQEFHDGHSWGNWRAHLDDILEYFFPETGQGVEGRDQQPGLFELGQNYPNPFNPDTTIPFSLRQDGVVTLHVYDALGRKVAGLLEERLHVGRHAVVFNAEGLASGSYFYRISVASQWDQRWMILVK